MSTPPSGATPQPPAGPPPAGPPPGPPAGFAGGGEAPPPHGAVTTAPAPHAEPTHQPPPAVPGPAPQPPAGKVSRTGLHHALLSEWTKIRTVRSTVWTIAVMLAVTVGIALLVNVGVSSADDVIPPSVPGAIGVIMGQIAILTLGVLVASTEYTTGMVRATLTACPARGRVLLAKILVFGVLSFVVTAAALGLSLLITNGMQGDTRYSVMMSGDDVANAVLGVALYVTLLGLLGIALGTLLRSSAGAVTLMVAVVLLPAVVTPFLYIAESTRDLAEILDEFAATGAIMALSADWTDINLDYGGWPQTGVLAIITGVALVGAYLRLVKSDA